MVDEVLNMNILTLNNDSWCSNDFEKLYLIAYRKSRQAFFIRNCI